MNRFALALSTLIGTIVGAGIFGLPYVISKSGIIPGLFYFAVLGGAVMLLHLLFGEVCLRTEGKHRLIGYAGLYVGDWARILIAVCTVVGIVGALLIYIIFGGNFLAIALSPFVEVPDEFASFLFWVVLSLCVLQGIQLLARLEVFMSLAMLFAGAVIFFLAFPHFQPASLPFFDQANLFLPYGVILFALVGWAAIPEVADLFRKDREKRSLDNVIVWTFAIVVPFYALFTLLVVGVSGQATSENALDGLRQFLGDTVIVLGSVFGLFALATSFLVLGNYLKNSFRYDFKFPLWVSGSLATLTPYLLFGVGVRDVIVVMGILGAVLGAIEGVVIILAYLKAKKKGQRKPEYSLSIPRFLVLFLVLLLVGGALVEIFASAMI